LWKRLVAGWESLQALDSAEWQSLRSWSFVNCRMHAIADAGPDQGHPTAAWRRMAEGLRAAVSLPEGVADPTDPFELLAEVRDHAAWLSGEVESLPGTAAATPTMPRHSEDFTSVHWFGADYLFTKAQAAVVKKLWEAWANGTPGLKSETLCEERRLIDIFKPGGKLHPAWGTMIVQQAKGVYALREPSLGRSRQKNLQRPRKTT
jgi:hypothetical protein